MIADRTDRRFKSSGGRIIHGRSFCVLILVVAANFMTVSPAVSCSTFMLAREGCVVIGHNLDQSFYTPGMIHVNRRSERKRSVSAYDIKLADRKSPILHWTSKYGSVTFSLLGRNLPDGGMNEAGLTLNEMGLGESVFSFADSLTAMLCHLWIQYQLDNFGTVGEVLDHLGDIRIEPISTFTPPSSANYHFFVTDSQGNAAVIEFYQGGPRVYRNESMPVPALCNLPYGQDLERVRVYRGIGGWIRRRLDSGKDLRFVRCADALEQYRVFAQDEPIGYCFDLLKSLQSDRTKQWSVVYDAKHRRVYFRTTRADSVKHFDFDSLDFSADATPMVIGNIDVDSKGDVSDRFTPFSPDADRELIGGFLHSLVRFVAKTEDAGRMDRHMIDHYGMDVSRYISRAMRTTELIRNPKK